MTATAAVQQTTSGAAGHPCIGRTSAEPVVCTGIGVVPFLQVWVCQPCLDRWDWHAARDPRFLRVPR